MAEGDNNTPEEEKEVTQQKQDQLDIIENMNKALEKQVQYQVRLKRLRGEDVSDAQRLSMLLGEQTDASRELLDLATQLTANTDDLVNTTQKYKELLDTEVEKGRMLFANAEAQKAVADEILRVKQEIVNSAGTENQEAEKRLKALIKELDVQERTAAARQAGATAGANLVNSIGSLVGMKPNPAMNDFFKAFQTGDAGKGLTGMMEGVSAQIGEVFSLGNMLGFVTSNLIELGIAFDSVAANVTAATGASREYSYQLATVSNDLRELGLGFEVAGSAQAALLADFPKFTELVTETGERNISLQNEMTKTAGALSKLGVDASTTADNFSFLVSSLGMTGEQANETFRTMIEQGANLGIPPQQLASALETLQPRLALFGARAPDILMKTAAAAKDLGLSVGELGGNLFQLSDGLDEFDEAAGKVAAFNLTLGGSFVDTYDLVMAASEGPFAQVEILQQGLAKAGKTLGGLNFREKQFMAKSFGMEIDMLTQIMDGQIRSQEELDKVQKENSKTIEDMVKEATPVLEKLAASLQGVFGPLSEILAPVAEIISTVASGMGSAFGPAVIGVFVVSIGKFISGMRQAKVEAAGMATNVANIATQLKILGLQAQKTQLADALKDTPGMIEEIKSRFPELEEGSEQFENIIERRTQVLDSAMESLDEQLSSVGGTLEEMPDAAGKAGKGFKGMGIGDLVQIVGTAVSAFQLLDGVLSGMSPQFQAVAGGLLLVAAGFAAAALAKSAFLTTPLGAVAAGVILGAGIAGIVSLVRGLGGGEKAAAPTPIGSIGKITAGGFDVTSGVDDAIVRNDGGKTKVTPINRQDQLIAAKPGGPIAQSLGGGSQIPERLIAALETIAAGMRTPSGNGTANAVNVTVELDKRKMGKAIVDIMNKEMSLT